MIQELAVVHSSEEISPGIFQLSVISRYIAGRAVPGQFINIKVEDSHYPLLRRPFSLFSVEGEVVSVVFNVIGLGTKKLSQKKKGDHIDLIGPLGNGFSKAMEGDYTTAVFVAGGLGIAPFPFLTRALPPTKQIVSFIGARSSEQIVRTGMKNVHVATDDGSEGFRGTVVDLIRQYFEGHAMEKPRLFACGPDKMIRSLGQFARAEGFLCYASLECSMACGIGLCQGCPVEVVGREKKYQLVCKDGPVFETNTIMSQQ
jgi:dihydroorotate dehydrogenase electron transfer subunit